MNLNHDTCCYEEPKPVFPKCNESYLVLKANQRVKDEVDTSSVTSVRHRCPHTSDETRARGRTVLYNEHVKGRNSEA